MKIDFTYYIKSIVGRVALLLLFTVCFCAANAQTDRQYIREGNSMYHHRQFDKAEVLYRKAIAKNPSNPQAVYNLGCALMMQNKDSLAISMYQKAAKIETNKMRLSKVYHNIGVICQNHQMYGEAIQAYEQSLRNNPKDDETRYNLVLCKRLQKKQPPKNNKNKQQKKKQDNKQDKDKNKDKNNDNKNRQPQQQKEQMSKDNAEQLLNAAMQSEQATQQRLRKAMSQPSSRKLQKNW